MATSSKISFHFNFRVSWPEEINQDSSSPIELGIQLNSSWMMKNNVSDVNVYFKDPVNSVRFISPKVPKLYDPSEDNI